ncbi:MAG: DNA polymerase III subunit delta [Actinobacteria bacterium]|uniref:DNA polymerase III subunit delta n=1 Tax=freshwater metagenome TaxID=449393 RepID=A0A6J6NPX3_9ZZZZ|nr:DNA polymerase III subunit delta [Actinomycetota bacterium]MSX69152.1 DNA polymerase III subunit delta [Actinomycetota bacterium]MSY15342.1 DNA polymerase III subunit delta [Actinomycetota bacterium]MSY65407.1 DNA polymerase III subunit delta [Actinomycetota bacterium]MSZ53789.1 DNA polymerase III subunit delta [Actinomycetota bacterium]
MGLVLIQGAEGLLADRAISEILAANPGAQVTTISTDEIEVGVITDALAPSLFADTRIVVIKEIQDLTAECSEEIIDYLGNPDENLNLLLWHKGGVKGKALVDKVKKAGAQVIAADAIKKDSEKSEFVRGEFKRLGRKISTEAVQALIDSLGSDLRELGAACSQLASDVADGKLIDEDDVAAYQQGRIETTGYDVADAVLDGKTAHALISLRNAINTGTDPVLIVSAIAASIRTMAKVSGASRGLKSFDLASQLGMPPWQIDKARRQLSGWSENALARSVIVLAQADADIKGAAADPAYALERAIITISTARGTK